MIDCNEDSSVYNGHYEIEVLVDRPVTEVWAQFLDIGSWVTTHGIENVLGTPGKAGAITRVSFKKAKELGMPPPHHHYCKLIKVVPRRQWLLKTYAERGGSYGMESMTAFDDGRLIPLGDKTRVTFNLFAEIKGDAVIKDPAGMSLGASREGMMQNLENLKRLLERT